MRNSDRSLAVAALLMAIGVAITPPEAANAIPSHQTTVIASAADGGLINIAARPYASCTS